MYLLQTGSLIRIHTPAKINLFLEVLERREDGFHEIETLMTAINIYDTLYFSANNEGQIRLTCRWAQGLKAKQIFDESNQRGSALGDLPKTTDNIVYLAVEKLRQRCGVLRGASIDLVKRIPAAAGLGGASSNAAAALIAANRAWKLGWSHRQLAELAAEIGSDVPFFFGCGMFGSGAAICRGRGERIEPIAAMPRWNLVVVRPPEGFATAEVYRNCQVKGKPVEIGPLLRALQQRNSAKIPLTMTNRLQSAAAKLSPWTERLQNEFNRLDLLAHQMSGSGSSYFGICRHARHARHVAAQLRSRGVGSVFCAFTIASSKHLVK